MHYIIAYTTGMYSSSINQYEIHILNFGYLSSGQSVFSWPRMWGSVDIFRIKKGSASKNVWDTRSVVILQLFASILCRNGPTPAQTSSLLKLLSHSDPDVHPVALLWASDQPVAQAATCSTHNKHERRTSMLPAGFEPSIPRKREAAD